MSDDAFSRMRPSAVLINTARGPVVDEEALVRALQAGRLAGAALDVFEHEPLPADSPLCRMDQVMLAPHNANSSPAAWEHVHQNTINNLLGVFQQTFPSRSFRLLSSGDQVLRPAADAHPERESRASKLSRHGAGQPT
jgi:phosphoglycerate dehydrogenase-like enzyme